MRCAKCQTDNREGRKFCAKCAAPLARLCPQCGASNEPGEDFCGECAAALTQAPVAPAKKSSDAQIRVADRPAAENIEGERKTVTALFADIKGSMELMEDLDPEEARAIVDPALKLMMDAVHRYDGYIVQSTGDGIFALFGAPVAHEDHPQRALYAALRMQEELKRYSDRLRQEGKLPLQARVGINTGDAVVRSIKTGKDHGEYTPIGHATGLASRMQALAPVGSIAVTGATRKLCEGYFSFKSLGTTQVKGVSEPVAVHEMTGLGPLRTRLQVAARRGLTKFVGRQGELEQMKHALELAHAGHGQIVAAMGEPGVGKSRLFFEFKAIAQSGSLVLEAYSVSHGKASAYLPVIDLLKSYFEIVPEDDERKRRERVNGKIVTLDRSLEDTLPYLFGLLGIVEGDDPLAQFDPQLRRRRTLEAVKRVLVRESLNQPLLAIFEDLHWIDSETQALLNLLVDGLATARILLLVNYRPEYHHQWGNKTYYTQLRLDPLGHESADEMLAELLGEGGELTPIKRLVIERTEGNPFFMEEMVQALFEQGVLVRNGAVSLANPLSDIRVPPTVQAILASRIDRLAAAVKELLQTLAVLGREFRFELIKRVTANPQDELERVLSELQLGEFIYEQPATGDIEYQFKHALTQEVSYSSVLGERRRILHERAAQAIEELYAESLDDHLPDLARHYDRSGNVAKAIQYEGRAGQRAALQMAHPEAIGHLKRALELLMRLPKGADHDRQELNLQVELGWSLFVLNPASAERGMALLRTQQLSEKLGDSSRLIETMLALGFFRQAHREYGLAREIAQKVLAFAEAANAQATVAGVHSLLGINLFFMGEPQAAREHLELAVAPLSDGRLHGFAQVSYARAAAIALPLTLLVLGYPDSAIRTNREFVKARLSDPVWVASNLLGTTILHCMLREGHSVHKLAEELSSVATEHAMSYHGTQASFYRGWAFADQGRAQEGIAEMLANVSRFGAAFTTGLVVLAATFEKNGRSEEGLATVAEGIREAERTGERIFLARLYGIQGDLILKRNPSDEAQAERSFRTAIDIARHQRARFWELHAIVSFAGLLKRQGKIDEAHGMLSEIYNWFTEGFDTADLKDAKALLDELSRS